jgi:hypothetical protein
LGQTGTGKSGALELLTISDIYYDQGFAVIDPHGDYAQHTQFHTRSGGLMTWFISIRPTRTSDRL